jgi:hypothetical protein
MARGLQFCKNIFQVSAQPVIPRHSEEYRPSLESCPNPVKLSGRPLFTQNFRNRNHSMRLLKRIKGSVKRNSHRYGLTPARSVFSPALPAISSQFCRKLTNFCLEMTIPCGKNLFT